MALLHAFLLQVHLACDVLQKLALYNDLVYMVLVASICVFFESNSKPNGIASVMHAIEPFKAYEVIICFKNLKHFEILKILEYLKS